jgi:uncharacterized protein involved in exopolysaccharide biosynthesis
MGLAIVLLRSRRLIAWSVFLSVVVLVGHALWKPRTFTSDSEFMPQAGKPQSALSGLAAQFEISLPTTDAGRSSAFFLELLRSREILGPVAESRFDYLYNGRHIAGPLTELLHIRAPDSLTRRQQGIDALLSTTDARLSAKTGVIHLAVVALDPELARLVNERILAELNRFNLSSRQSQAASERRFTEQRLADARRELRDAEDRAQGFLQRNREYRSSPTLSFEYNRLTRDVEHTQQIYTAVAQAFEQARVEEVRDTPVITIVERPEAPSQPDRRRLLRLGFIALLGGLGVGIILAFIRNMVRATEGPAARSELVGLRDALMRDLKRPWRLLVRSRHEAQA